MIINSFRVSKFTFFCFIESPGFGEVPCCPKEYAKDCCGKVDACDSSYTVGRTPAEMYGPLKYKALCSEPLNTTACIAGFYKNSSGASLPCPPGMFYA